MQVKISLASNVPPALPIDINVAHVAAIYRAHHLAIFLDLTLNIVSAFLLSNRVGACDTVLLVREFTGARDAMDERAPQRIVNLVLVRGVLDHAAVFELDCLTTFDIEVDRVHVDSRRVTGVARPLV